MTLGEDADDIASETHPQPLLDISPRELEDKTYIYARTVRRVVQ